jgi:hypothetical protein
MSSVLISEYIGRGPIGSRPAAPDVASGVAAFWFATDTDILSVWDGSTWQDVVPTGGGGALAVVQHQVLSTSDLGAGITLTNAPQNGNFLYAISFRFNSTTSLSSAAGWSTLSTSGPNGLAVLQSFKVAGPGEPALQANATNAVAGAIAIWELENVRSIIGVGNSSSASSTSGSATVTSARVSPGLLLGAAAGNSGEIPVISGASTAQLSFGGPPNIGGVSYQGSVSSFASSSYSSTATYAVATGNRNTVALFG